MLKGKVSIITGSTSGIGLGIAKALAKSGSHVVINGFGNGIEIERICLDIQTRYSVKAIYDPADMTKPKEIEAMVHNTAKTLGSIDIIVNNAGIQHVSPICEFPVEKWDAIIAIDLSSAFHVMRHAIPYMKKKKWGRILNIGSAHSLVASPFKSAYVAAKHGLLGMTKSVAMEVAEEGITCNAICPGYVLTPLVENQIGATAMARNITEEQVVRDVMLGEQATKKFVKVEELAAFAVFLCSEGAASITGAALPIDGGWTAH